MRHNGSGGKRPFGCAPVAEHSGTSMFARQTLFNEPLWRSAASRRIEIVQRHVGVDLPGPDLVRIDIATARWAPELQPVRYRNSGLSGWWIEDYGAKPRPPPTLERANHAAAQQTRKLDHKDDDPRGALPTSGPLQPKSRKRQRSPKSVREEPRANRAKPIRTDPR